MKTPTSRSILDSLACAGVLGTLSAFGDWVWARYITDGAVVPGVVHGVIVFAMLAVLLGWVARSWGVARRLLLSLPLAGLLIAASFYPLAWVLGYLGALLATWVGMWLVLAFLARWARGAGAGAAAVRESSTATLMRALSAAVLSGLVFWAISGIWTQPSPDPNYLLRAVKWSAAFLPGFAGLLLRSER